MLVHPRFRSRLYYSLEEGGQYGLHTADLASRLQRVRQGAYATSSRVYTYYRDLFRVLYVVFRHGRSVCASGAVSLHSFFHSLSVLISYSVIAYDLVLLGSFLVVASLYYQGGSCSTFFHCYSYRETSTSSGTRAALSSQRLHDRVACFRLVICARFRFSYVLF